MNNTELDEFHCSICFDRFGDDSKAPRVLTCGHSLCTSCLTSIIWINPECPTCRKKIENSSSHDVPINLSIKSLIERQNSFNSSIPNSSEAEDDHNVSHSSGSLPNQGMCIEHANYKQIRCMNCNIFICGTCALVAHSNCKVLLISKAVREIKKQRILRAESELAKNYHYIHKFQRIIEDAQRKKAELERQIQAYQLAMQEKQGKLRHLTMDIVKLNSCMKVRQDSQNEFQAIKSKINSSSTFEELENNVTNWSQSLRKVKENVARHYQLHNRYFKTSDGKPLIQAVKYGNATKLVMRYKMPVPIAKIKTKQH